MNETKEHEDFLKIGVQMVKEHSQESDHSKINESSKSNPQQTVNKIPSKLKKQNLTSPFKKLMPPKIPKPVSKYDHENKSYKLKDDLVSTTNVTKRYISCVFNLNS
jgi:hypothetical protein